MPKLKYLTICLIASGSAVGIANAYKLPSNITDPVPSDSSPYYSQYVTNGVRPCPHTLTPTANADILRGKADLMDALADVSDGTAGTAEEIAEIYDNLGDAAGELKDLPLAKHPYVKAAVSAVEHGCSASAEGFRCAAEAERDEASQMRAWAREMRRQASEWDAIKKACGDDININKND